MKKTLKQKTAEFWDNNKLDIIPCVLCVCVLGLLGASYVGMEKYNIKKAELHNQQKLLNSVDTVNAVRDTIALNAIQKQK